MLNAIEIKDVSKNYKDKQVLKKLSLNVPQHTVFGLVGENGAGKTTLMKSILGLVNISSGDIFINGFNVKNDKIEMMHDVSFLLEPRYYSYLNAYDTLKNTLILANRYNEESPQRIMETLEILKLGDVAKKSIKKFSSGMKQRVGLAQALICQPSILILDEPLIGLDMQGTKLFKKMIKELSEEKKSTIFISSHQLSEVQEICSEIAFLENGVISIHDKTENMVECISSFTFEQKINYIPEELKRISNKIYLSDNKMTIHIVSSDKELFKKVTNTYSSNKIVDVTKKQNGLEHYFSEKGDTV